MEAILGISGSNFIFVLYANNKPITEDKIKEVKHLKEEHVLVFQLENAGEIRKHLAFNFIEVKSDTEIHIICKGRTSNFVVLSKEEQENKNENHSS
ncbi:MAG: hypothetical protein WCO35_01355 [Candidatus Nomurabacteria bacterium]